MTVVNRLKFQFALPLLSQANKKLYPFPFPFPNTNLNLSSLSSYLETIQNPNPNHNTIRKEENLMFLLKRCSTGKELNQIHSHIIHLGFEQNLFLVGKIIVFCAVSEFVDMDYAVSVFDRIENPDGFLFNTMIRGFGKANIPERAFGFYEQMQRKGMAADNFTLSFLLKVSENLGSVLLGKQLHCNILKLGLHSHEFVRNTLIHVYGMFKDTKTALHLFDEISEPSLVSWNTIIDCHVNCGMFKEAIELFLLMLKSGMDPDEATLVVILSACSSFGALEFGTWVHSCINDNHSISLQKSIPISNSLIDMYAKCGFFEQAYEIFDRMEKKSIVTWNTMIMGLATHGEANKALEVFVKLSEEKYMKPDEITFLGVLCACSHGGKVDEGRKYFDLMRKEYLIKPTLKHYGCMVDILGRAGFVEEAYDLVKSMPMECNSIVWRILLAACSVHGNVRLGETVRRHLLELDPDHSSDYVLLANTYASVDQWNDMIEVRQLMNDRGAHKSKPGNSYITQAFIAIREWFS